MGHQLHDTFRQWLAARQKDTHQDLYCPRWYTLAHKSCSTLHLQPLGISYSRLAHTRLPPRNHVRTWIHGIHARVSRAWWQKPLLDHGRGERAQQGWIICIELEVGL